MTPTPTPLPRPAEEVRSSDLRGCYLLMWEDTASDGAQQLAWGSKAWLLSILSFNKDLSPRETSGQAQGVYEHQGNFGHN